MTEDDLRRIATFNATEASFPDNATLHGLIEAQIERHASEIAVICDHDDVLGTPVLTFRATQRASQSARPLFAGRGC